MAKLTLKSLIGKRSELKSLLESWCEMTNTDIVIEDTNQNLLFGKELQTYEHSFSVIFEGDLFGFVHGKNSTVEIISQLLSMMLSKEAEKKNLGTEVLQLYQELNVIYNFSEKLVDTIEPEVIAHLTLEQAIHSIPSGSGVILVWDEEKSQLTIPASSDEKLFNKELLYSNSIEVLKIVLGGQSEIMSDLSNLKNKGIIDTKVESVVFAAMKVKKRILGAIILADTKADQYTAAHLKLLVTLALQSSTAIESALLYEKNIREVKEREEAMLRIHEVTKKFVPLEFISSLGKDSLIDVKLGDLTEKIVTVLFTDIRDFTSLSENMTPQENFRFVSSFNEKLGPIIRIHHGFINQYLGDSIMAIFPRHPNDALNAAIAMQKAIFDMNIHRQVKGLPILKAGIGMHTGSLIMGITGDENRLDASTISDTVNTASRIESLTKYYHSPLLLSSETLSQIGDHSKYDLRKLGKVQLKGKNQLISIVECINGYPSYELEKKRKNLDIFNRSMSQYFDQRFDEALLGFQSIIESDPDDHTVRLFMQKSLKFIREGVPEQWTGAEEMVTK